MLMFKTAVIVLIAADNPAHVDFNVSKRQPQPSAQTCFPNNNLGERDQVSFHLRIFWSRLSDSR